MSKAKLTIKTLERRDWHYFVVFIVNFEHYIKPFSNVWIAAFEQVNVCWGGTQIKSSAYFYI